MSQSAFSPEYTTPKKARTKGQSTPSKSIKSALAYFIYIYFFFDTYSLFFSGKKRAVINSDEEDIFISRYGFLFTFYVIYISLFLISPLDNSAKKQRFEETLTPAKRVKNAGRQLVFDNAV